MSKVYFASNMAEGSTAAAAAMVQQYSLWSIHMRGAAGSKQFVSSLKSTTQLLYRTAVYKMAGYNSETKLPNKIVTQ